jgi:hypothetical protein
MRLRKSVDLESEVQSTPGPYSPAVNNRLRDIRAPTPILQPDKAALTEAAVTAFLSQWSNSNVDLWWNVLDVTTI